jgi:hypothetical protein
MPNLDLGKFLRLQSGGMSAEPAVRDGPAPTRVPMLSALRNPRSVVQDGISI